MVVESFLLAGPVCASKGDKVSIFLAVSLIIGSKISKGMLFFAHISFYHSKAFLGV